MKSGKRKWRVAVPDETGKLVGVFEVEARQRGGACREAFRQALRAKLIKRQPASFFGGFENVIAEVIR